MAAAGCGQTYYGVTEEIWFEMNDAQKQAAIEGYNQRDLLRTKHRIEQERIKDEHDKRLARQRQQQVEKIYNGGGQLGDLVQISILSGQIKLGFKDRSIEPVSVKLANGESREMEARSTGSRYIKYKAKIPIQYSDGLLMIGADQSGRGGIRIPYDHAWLKGKAYKGITGKGVYKMENMHIKIVVIPQWEVPAIIVY